VLELAAHTLLLLLVLPAGADWGLPPNNIKHSQLPAAQGRFVNWAADRQRERQNVISRTQLSGGPLNLPGMDQSAHTALAFIQRP
jgi:hypothetical protein